MRGGQYSGGLIGHSTGRRSLSTVGGTHVCPPNRGERSTRMMHIKFNFNNFIFYNVSARAWQHASGIRGRRWRLWLAYPTMTSFRYVPDVACVALDGNPALYRPGVLTVVY